GRGHRWSPPGRVAPRRGAGGGGAPRGSPGRGPRPPPPGGGGRSPPIPGISSRSRACCNGVTPNVELLLVLAVGLAAGTISGIVGFGSTIMLMPVLVFAFGPPHAVPIMAVGGLLATFSSRPPF